MSDFPKWVKPHPNHLFKQAWRPDLVRAGSENSIQTSGDHPDHVSAPAFAQTHVARDGTVTVLVNSEAEEHIALSDPHAVQHEDHGEDHGDEQVH
jgi:hypothetical protein